MFARFGYPENEASTRARVLYFTQIGHFTLQMKETLPMRMDRVRDYLKTFSGIEPTPEDMAALEKAAARRQEDHSDIIS